MSADGEMHTVRQGDYLSKVAKQYGYADWKAIWDDLQNTKHGKKHQNAVWDNVLPVESHAKHIRIQ